MQLKDGHSTAVNNQHQSWESPIQIQTSRLLFSLSKMIASQRLVRWSQAAQGLMQPLFSYPTHSYITRPCAIPGCGSNPSARVNHPTASDSSSPWFSASRRRSCLLVRDGDKPHPELSDLGTGLMALNTISQANNKDPTLGTSKNPPSSGY